MFRENYQIADQKIINTDTSLTCKACGLYINQLPIFDNQKRSNIFWVGLSAVKISENEAKQPLSPFTRSGELIKEIESLYSDRFSFYKTNLVKCLPLKSDKIRYPLKHEMIKCSPNLETEIDTLKPSLVFLLGKQVSSFIIEKLTNSKVILDDKFCYDSIKINNVRYIPIHHPSYILIYRRKHKKNYIEGIRFFLERLHNPKIPTFPSMKHLTSPNLYYKAAHSISSFSE
ncbi:MAG: uracil-DNA glycosylase family protein [Bacteroidales bacterium]|nr:uracil-DNA glycosylase family protein [Bacteroidales bacterium]